MMCRWQVGETVYASDVESRNPIDGLTLSQWMIELLADERNRGIYHTGASDSMTRYEIAQEIAAQLQVPTELVQPELLLMKERAPRGIDHFLLTKKLSRVCATPPPSCQQVIHRSLHEVAQGSLRTGV
jgi:dTDP-4-dehydrorhamnose reductase